MFLAKPQALWYVLLSTFFTISLSNKVCVGHLSHFQYYYITYVFTKNLWLKKKEKQVIQKDKACC